MIDLQINQFWSDDTPEPPTNKTIGEYDVQTNIHNPTKYSYIYFGNKHSENEQKALKFIKCSENRIGAVKNEIEIMKMINHPNILKIEDYFTFNGYACIVTPYYPKKSLHELILRNYSKGIPEKMASCIMFQVLSAVNYLHKQNIWHRDIKPENILVEDSDQKNPKVILADFGFAKKVEQDNLCDEILGTPEFIAPEMYNIGEYTNKVDIWSLGVSLFVMLVAKFPTCSFNSNPRRCRSLIQRGILNFKLLEDSGISDDAIDLVKQMCKFDPKERITAESALNHRWITRNMETKETRIEDDFVFSQNNEMNYW